MNESRKRLIVELRKKLDDVLKPEHTDKYLLKFLRGSSYNLKKAEQLYRQKLYARQVYELDTWDSNIYEKPEVAQKYEFHGYIGQAKDGSPIRYVNIGKADFIGFVKSMSIFQIGRYCAGIIEEDIRTMEMQNKLTGEELDGVTYILDLEEMSLLQFAHKPVIEMGLDLLRMLQDQYPDVWKIIICVNAPFYFDKAFNLFKPILRRSLTDKMRVASKENSAYELLKWIDADVLPEFLGGNRRDSNDDPKCSEFLRFGGQVPLELYLMNKPLLQETDPGVEVRWVPARSVYNHVVVVKEAGSRIRMQMRTEKANIGACLVYKKFGPDPDCIEMPPTDQYLDENNENSGIYGISPPCIAQTHIAPIDDGNYCPWPGFYIFRFDNTYSWINSKKLIYKTWVIPPNS